MKINKATVQLIFGDRLYERIKEFFRQFLLAESETKLLLTRRSYVLYKIFREILEEEQFDFAQVGNVYNTHSMCNIPMGEDAQGVLVCDDIIVNGRTMKYVLKTLCEKHQIRREDISIWCLQCNESAAFLKDFEDNICHAKYVNPYQWQKFSDLLTDCIVMTNIGYISLVDSYHVYPKAEKIIWGDLRGCHHEWFDSKTQPMNAALRIECCFKNDFSGMDRWERFGAKPLVRFYRSQDSLLVIPMVFLPAMALENVLDYCLAILGEFHRVIPAIGEDQSPEHMVQLYKWTMRELGNYLIEEYFQSLGLNVSEDAEVALQCAESFRLEKKKIPAHTSYHYEKNVPETTEMQECRAWFNEALKGAAAEEGVNKYLAKVRREDDERAQSGRERIFGLSFQAAYTLLQAKLSDEGAVGTAEVLAEIIAKCDVGAFAYVVESYTIEGVNYISGLLRHGEQAMRALFTAYSDVYGILYNFFCYTNDTSSNEIEKFLEFYGKRSGYRRLQELKELLCYDTLFADMMTISPESVGGQDAEKYSESIVAEYHRKHYGESR